MTPIPLAASRFSQGVWLKGKAPLKRIVLLWNGKGLFGPVTFHTRQERDLYYEHLADLEKTVYPIPGTPTHYLIVPKCKP